MVGQKQRLQVRTTTKTSSSNKQPAHAQQQMNRNLNNNGSSRNSSSSSSHRQHRQRQHQGCGGVCCFSSSTCNKNTTIMMLLSLCSFVLLSRHVLWEEISFSSAVLYYNSNNNDYDDCSSDDNNNNDDDDDIRTTHSSSSCQKKKNNKRIVVNNIGDEQQQQQQQNRIAQQHVEVVSNNNNNPKSSSSVSKIMNKNKNHHLIRPHHPQPRVMSYVWNEDDHVYEGQQLPLLPPPPSPSSDNNKKRRRRVKPMGNTQKQREIKDKDKLTLDPPETETCKLKYNWQKTFQPNCNILHELIDTSHGMPFFVSVVDKNKNDKKKKNDTNNNWYYKIVGEGYWRDVWLIQNFYSYQSTSKVEKSVYKTMRFEHEYTQRNVDRMRRDAAAMEHLTSSKYIIDIYAYCGTSSLSEFGDGGDIPNAIYPPSDNNKQSKLTQIEKLRIATQASIGLADVHNVDKEGEATIAHTDITPTQFIKVQDVYKLNDFNRARFLTYNTQSKNNHSTLCPYHVGNNPGKFRSPEEYDYEGQTELVDVYSMGNIFFLLLQEEWPFDDISSKSARKQVLKGQRPSVYLDLWNSTDPVNVALKEAMIMCHVHDPKERVSARTLETFLRKKLQEIDPVGYRNLKRS